MTKEFLPQGERVPASTGRYMRFEDGDNKFRVLDSAITGWELWVEKRPLRRKTAAQFTTEELANADPNPFDPNGARKRPRYFWAFPVYNYASGKVEILEITQSTIMTGIEGLLDDEEYGKEPWTYDIVVSRDTESKPISYFVRPKPPKELEPDVKKMAYNEVEKIDLTALFRGEDPFAKKNVSDDSEVNIPFE